MKIFPKIKKIDSSDYVLAACCVFMAFAFSFGANFAVHGYQTASTRSLFLQMILLIPVFCFIFFVFDSLVSNYRIYSLNQKNKNARLFKRRNLLNTSFLVVFTTLLLSWTIWIIALYPGAMNWDTFYQIWMTYPENHPIASDWETSNQYLPSALSDHHPLFDTLIYGFFARTSHILFGTWNIGVFIFIIIQVLCFATLIVFALQQLCDLSVPKPVLYFTFGFFALFPVIPAYSSTMLKDSSFSLFFLGFFLGCIEIAKSHGEILINRKATLLFAIFALLCALTKKTGLYVVVPTILFFSIIYRHVWKQLCLSAFVPFVVIVVLFPMFVFPLLDVAPGGKQEMLSLPFQMTARYVVDHGDEVTENERAAIDAVLRFDSLASRYKSDTTDPVKNQFITGVSNEKLVAYIKVWIEQGLKHPGSYISALMGVTSRFFAPSTSVGVLTYTGDIDHGGSKYVWQPSQTSGLRHFLETVFIILKTTPIISLFFNAGLYSLLLPLFSFFYFFKHKESRWCLPALIPIFISFISCLISPIFDPRYVLQMIFVSPLLFSLLFSKPMFVTN